MVCEIDVRGMAMKVSLVSCYTFDLPTDEGARGVVEQQGREVYGRGRAPYLTGTRQCEESAQRENKVSKDALKSRKQSEKVG